MVEERTFPHAQCEENFKCWLQTLKTGCQSPQGKNTHGSVPPSNSSAHGAGKDSSTNNLSSETELTEINRVLIKSGVKVGAKQKNQTNNEEYFFHFSLFLPFDCVFAPHFCFYVVVPLPGSVLSLRYLALCVCVCFPGVSAQQHLLFYQCVN